MSAQQVFGGTFKCSALQLTTAISATFPGVDTGEGINDVNMANLHVETKDCPTLYKWDDVDATFDMGKFDDLQKLITNYNRKTRKMNWTIYYPGLGTLTDYWGRMRSVKAEQVSTETNNHRWVCRAVIEFCGRDQDGTEVVPDFAAE